MSASFADSVLWGVVLPPRIDSPPGVAFADLELQRDPRGCARLRQDVFEHVCRHHGIDPHALEDVDVAYVIFVWYRSARERGDAPNLAMEQMHHEACAEALYGWRVVQGSTRVQ